MQIVEYFSSENKQHWLEQIGKSDWSAGKFLYELLCDETLRKTVGENALVPLLIDGEKLISFCTFGIYVTVTTIFWECVDKTNPWSQICRLNFIQHALLDWCNSVATIMEN